MDKNKVFNKDFGKKEFNEMRAKDAWEDLDEFIEAWKRRWEKEFSIIYIYNLALLDPKNYDVYHSEWRSNINSIDQFNVMHEDIIREIAVHEHSVMSVDDDVEE